MAAPATTADVSESMVPMIGDVLAEPMPFVDDMEEAQTAFFPMEQDDDHSHRALWVAGGGMLAVPFFLSFTNDHGHQLPGPGVQPPNFIPVPDPGPPDQPIGPPVTTTPEPGTLALVATGLAALAGSVRRKKRR
jgi:hypothetical protein